MSVEQMGPLASPNSRYRKDIEYDVIGCVTGLLDEIIELTPVKRSATCTALALSQWCEVETISLPCLSPNQNDWVGEFNRLFMRHDIIFTGDEAGDVYRVHEERGIVHAKYDSLSRKGVLLYIPSDAPQDYSVALQTYLSDPSAITTFEEEPDLPTLERFARIAKHDFFSPNRMTEFELEELFDSLGFVLDALKYGANITT